MWLQASLIYVIFELLTLVVVKILSYDTRLIFMNSNKK